MGFNLEVTELDLSLMTGEFLRDTLLGKNNTESKERPCPELLEEHKDV